MSNWKPARQWGLTAGRTTRLTVRALWALPLLSPLVCASTAQAQQVFANGTKETAVGTITTVNQAALFAINNGVIQSYTPLTITANGGDGAWATTGGQIAIAVGSSIVTTGTTAIGVSVVSVGSLITVGNGTQITTSDAYSSGFYVYDGGQINAVGVTIDTAGVQAHGMVVYDSGLIDAAGAIITTSGDSSHGMAVFVAGQINAENASVTTTGAASHGIYMTSIGAISVSISDSTISTQGTAASAVSSAGSNTIAITNSALSSENGIGIDAVGGALTATVVNSTITGSFGLLSVGPGATLGLDATGSTFTGSAMTALGGTSNINLQSTNWTVTGDSNVTSLTNGAGSVVHFTPPASSAGPFKTLTTVNYVGQGGTLGINTVLGADGSPSDQLIIVGEMSSGTSQLAVNNVGGLGDLTQLNGILVVDAINSGTTVPGLLALAGPVVAGPYEYSLYRGSVDASNPNAWYLRSELNCALDPSAPICGGDIPDWRQETSLYAAVRAMALLYGRLMLDTLHERHGTAVSAYAEGAPNAAWARVIGQHGDRDGGKGGIYGAGPKYDYDFWAFQGG
ncbi:pertactin-like passenger domain-containing protein, partial [Hyphomicrobium sulfonivorans]|uniref:pertactin-like passenger domain-containing protein n=1 Tax=Hyphomicrobium sulfonivorans TaxID=121290 RepID=UPI0023428C0F